MITHPEKLLFPEDGITKGELAAYYEAVAPLMLPHLQRPAGHHGALPLRHRRKGFWQKDVSRGFPTWLQRVEVPKKDGVVHHPLADDTRSLLWMANQNGITPHVWPSRVPELLHPDLCVFDLDPSGDEPEVARAATLACATCSPSSACRAGSRPPARRASTSCPAGRHGRLRRGRRFAHRVGALLVKRDPERLTQEFIKADRGGRILVDTGRNG